MIAVAWKHEHVYIDTGAIFPATIRRSSCSS